MSRRRRSYETGHKPKLLVVIDDTEECDRAVYFASRRAARIGGNVIMLRVIEMHDQSQQWLGVADIMRAEAHEEADAQLSKYAARANGIAGITPERVVREGEKAEEILRSDRRGRGHIRPRSGRRHRSRRDRVRWSPASAGPRATTRSRWLSCPATSPTRNSTRCHEAAVIPERSAARNRGGHAALELPMEFATY